MLLKKIRFFFSRKNHSKAERLVRATYFGLLHRAPETTNLKILTKKIVEGLDYLDLLLSILKSPEFMRKIPPNEMNDFLATIELEPKNKDPETFQVQGDIEKFTPQNLIYFCPAIAWPLGGIKVIARHSEIINSANLCGFSSELFFPENQDFDLSWFEHNAKIKKNNKLNRETDIIIIPEIWALKYGFELIKAGVKYSLFCQNGYYIFDEVYKGDCDNLLKLKKIYQEAYFILSVSDDTSICIQQAFQIRKENIFKIRPSINSNLFKYQKGKKKNIITYMPRKLSQHANWLINLIKLRYSATWEIIEIEGQNEKVVANILRESKIFLSFSDREGLSLPPLEASICGNSVIGYTGQGAKEYFNNILFKEIESGNLRQFFDELSKEMHILNSQDFLDVDSIRKKEALSWLVKEFSLEKEKNCLASILTKIKHKQMKIHT